MKRLTPFAVLAVLTLLILAGCTFAPSEVSGTWVREMNSGTEFAYTETLKFGSSVTYKQEGYYVGVWKGSIKELMPDLGYIRAETTSASGSLEDWGSYTTWYLRYMLWEDGSLTFAYNPYDYPYNTNGFGPFFRE